MPYYAVFRAVFVICLVILTYLLLIEMAPAHDGFIYKDKIQHVIAFGGVTFWGLLAFESLARRVMIALALFGALMEVLQGVLTTTRQPSVYDWVADVVGILLAYAIVGLLQRWWKQRRG